MEKTLKERRVTWLIWLVFWATCCAAGQDAVTFNISQTAVHPPYLTAYLDVLDKAGRPPTHVRGADVVATLDGRQMPLTDLKFFDASGEGVAYFFLVDISKSIRPAEFNQIRQAMYAWIDDLRPQDRIAVATFGREYHLLLDFTGDKQAARAAVAPIGPSDDRTLLHLGLRRALDIARRNDKDLPMRRVVVILSDGKDEGSGITVEDLRPQIQTSNLPIYAIGYSNLPTGERQYYLDMLHRLASLSGGAFREATPASLAEDYAAINGSIHRVVVAKFTCNGCQLSSNLHPLQINLTSHSVVVSDKADVGLAWTPLWRRIPIWGYFIAAAVLAGIVVLILALFRKRPTAEVLEEIPNPPIPSNVGPTKPSQQVGLPIKLATVTGSQVGHVHALRLSERARIGRAADCDVMLQDGEVSGHHCDLVVANGCVMLHDLGSMNGTLVNGSRVVKQARLESGDLIRLGRTELRIVVGKDI